MEEGVRAEMLRAVMEDAAAAAAEDDAQSDDQPEEEKEEEEEKRGEEDTEMRPEETKPSTASSLSHYLSQPLTYTTDSNGQPICLDAEGNGVMMGWERDIMRQTVDRMVDQGWADRKGKKREVLLDEEERGDRYPLKVVNVGFGLGIVSLVITRSVERKKNEKLTFCCTGFSKRSTRSFKSTLRLYT
jgi:protein arginine N-methyltransferase 2